MKVHRLRLALAATLLSACFNPHTPEGRPCGDDGWCPPRQECIDLVCRGPDWVRPDAAPTDGAAPDAEPPLSDNADLEALSLSVPGLDFPFAPARTEYNLDVSRLVRSLRVTAKPEDVAATLNIQGSLVTGGDTSPPISVEPDTVVDITVTAPAGNTKTYTITVSPDGDVAQYGKDKADNADLKDYFGWDAAIDGDTLAVSASGEASCDRGVDASDKEDDACPDSGAVYVFRRDRDVWKPEAYLKPSDTGTTGKGDEFGISLALDGDTLVVGAFREDSASSGVNSQPDEMREDSGAAYVFRRGDQGWIQEAYLKPANPQARQNFGWSVAVAGDRIAVGARLEDHIASDSGAVYLFHRQGETWEPEAQLTADVPVTQAFFGYSVAVAEDVVVVGACGHGCPPSGQRIDPVTTGGTAYVFHLVGEDWIQVADLASLVSPIPGPGDAFGFSVALSKDTAAAVIGVRYEDSGSQGIDGDANDDSAPDSGAAYVFRRMGMDWTRDAYLKAHNTEAGDKFGASVAISDGLVAVGAPEEGDGDTQQGAVYLYRFDEGWSQLGGRIKSSNPVDQDGFGWSVALSDDALVVGAPFADDEAGVMYRFH